MTFFVVTKNLLTQLPDTYYCANEVEDLAMVDDIPLLKNLSVPHELCTCVHMCASGHTATRQAVIKVVQHYSVA